MKMHFPTLEHAEQIIVINPLLPDPKTYRKKIIRIPEPLGQTPLLDDATFDPHQTSKYRDYIRQLVLDPSDGTEIFYWALLP